MGKEILELHTIEQIPGHLYKKLEETFGGEWNGTTFQSDSALGKIEITSHQYPNGAIIALADYLLHAPVHITNQPQSEESIVAIQIGIHGDMEGNRHADENAEGILIYNANQPFKLFFPANKNIRWMSVRFPLSFFELWTATSPNGTKLLNILQSEQNWFYYHRLTPELEALVRSAFLHIKDDRLGKPILFARAYEITARLVAMIDEGTAFNLDQPKVHPDDFYIIHQVKEDLLSNFNKAPNIEELAEKYGMSKSKLQRTFKMVFNEPIKSFFNQHRLEEANRLLTYTEKSILEISEELGFHSASHLSRTFKQQFGYSPNSLRSN
ncbi:helix-turn-helix transcriptional regulator [Persicobacter sp. CCB-QB2]|uniref:helix-turn-helix transcriptional regulator n=1 Tax=Persicobacter sp. CCB-QB2 TaxID=1561025 RepID=UPI0006A950AF|nr:AraC family transcriptional regulator [Persicobacter sp. CCB-QB2]